MLLKNSLNVNVQDFHVGYKLEYDFKKVKSLVALLGLTNRQGDFFFKADTTKQHFTLGCNHAHSLTSLHSIETVYDHTKSTNGLFG